MIILFGGGTKDTQQSDIKKAKELYKDYKERKKQAKKTSAKKRDDDHGTN